MHFDGERQHVQRDGERLVHDGIQDFLGALLAVDLQPLIEAELVEDVQALDVVEVEVAEEKVDRQVVVDVAVGLVDAVARVEDDVVLVRVDEGADGVAGVGVVPAVGAEEDDLHVDSPASMMGIMHEELKDFCKRNYCPFNHRSGFTMLPSRAGYALRSRLSGREWKRDLL